MSACRENVGRKWEANFSHTLPTSGVSSGPNGTIASPVKHCPEASQTTHQDMLLSYPARIRTWKNRTKTCCDTVSPPGNGCAGILIARPGPAGRLAGPGNALLGLLDLVGQVLELDAQVDGHDVHVGGTVSGTGAKLRMPVIPLATICSATRWAASAGTQRRPRLILWAETSFRIASIGSTFRPSWIWPILPGVAVEDRHDLEPAGAETAIPEQGPAQVAEAHQGQRPVAVDPQDLPQGRGQLVDPIADAGMAELAEEREVLAHLGILDRQRLPELAARDGRLALALKRLELAEVEAHPPHDRLGGQLHSLGLVWPLLHEGRLRVIRRCRGKIHAITLPDSNCRRGRGQGRSSRPSQEHDRQGWARMPWILRSPPTSEQDTSWSRRASLIRRDPSARGPA